MGGSRIAEVNIMELNIQKEDIKKVKKNQSERKKKSSKSQKVNVPEELGEIKNGLCISSIHFYDVKDSKMVIGNILLNDAYVIKGFRVVDGENGLFVSHPQKKIKGDYLDVSYPVSEEVRDRMQTIILAAYNKWDDNN